MNLYLYVPEGLADWEIAYLTAELRSRRFCAPGAPECAIVTVGETRNSVATMGGFVVAPDMAAGEADIGENDILVLPGADAWMGNGHQAILEVAARRVGADLPVAAICGATVALARAGALDAKAHTSNGHGFLEAMAPGYRGAALYRDEPVVVDRGLITATFAAPAAFAAAVMRATGLYRPATVDAWEALNRTGRPELYYELAASMEG